MMADQLEHYKEFLENNGFSVEKCDDTSLFVMLNIIEIPIKVKCQFPDHFPYQFPKIFLLEENRKLFAGIPHIIEDGSLCLFNNEDAFPNFLDADNQLLSVLAKAKKILEDGLLKTNIDDFTDEIAEYWGANKCEEIRFFNDFSISVTLMFIKEYSCNTESYYIATDKAEHLNKLVSDSPNNKNFAKKTKYGIYIPLSTSLTTSDIANEKSLWCAIRQKISIKQKNEICSLMKRYYSNNTNSFTFIISLPSNNQNPVYLAWNSNRVQKIDGFRNNTLSIFDYWSLFPINDKCKIDKFKVVLCSQSYLFTRGSYGYCNRINSSTVIGCGSIGSHLSEELTTTGTNKLILIDDDILSINNIARHTCGYDFVNFPKVYSLKYSIHSHNPNVNCIAYSDNAFGGIEKHIDEINSTDLIFLAVGNLPLEAYVLNYAKNGIIKVPIIICWVEPRCYAAHMIYIGDPSNIFDEIINRNSMTYKNTVIQQSGSFIIHDAGCQSGYVPYSGLDVEQYLTRSLHELISIFNSNQKSNNYHLIWFGEISDARRNNIKVNKKYNDVADFSFVVRRLQ